MRLTLNLDGSGQSGPDRHSVFRPHAHALRQTCDHGFELALPGDLEVDAHHTVEDCGLALGQAFVQALGDKKGLRRYGTGFDPRNPFTGEAYVPMDECLARCVIDFGGRPYLVWRGLGQGGAQENHRGGKEQDASSAFRFGLAREFFQAFANEGRCNLHLELLYGDEPHHIVEAFSRPLPVR